MTPDAGFIDRPGGRPVALNVNVWSGAESVALEVTLTAAAAWIVSRLGVLTVTLLGVPGLAAAQVAARPAPSTAIAKIRESRARPLPVMRAPELRVRWHWRPVPSSLSSRPPA